MDFCGRVAAGWHARGLGFESPQLHWSEAKFENPGSEYSRKVPQRQSPELAHARSDRASFSASTVGRVLGLGLMPEAVKLVSCENALVPSPLTLAAHACAAVLARLLQL